jgi:hypothetical protein
VNTPIGLADLIIAWRSLGVADRGEAEKIAASLGHELTRAPSTGDPHGRGGGTTGTQPATWRSAPEPKERSDPELAAASRERESISLVATERAPAPPPAWWHDTELVHHLVRPAAPTIPLLTPTREREIVDSLGRGSARIGPPDVDALVERVARALPIASMPRSPVSALERHMQVLVDRRPPMAPFQSDVQELIGCLHRLLGVRLEVLGFAESPARVGPRFVAHEHLAPPPRSTVLVLSSLDSFSETEPWLRLCHRMNHAEVSICALSPYRTARISPAVRRALSVFYWSQSLTPAKIVEFLDVRRRLAG